MAKLTTGVVISTLNVNKTDIKGNLYTAECGAKLSDIILDMKNNCLGGLEFAYSIPATVGGAVSMNAGCFNKDISEYVCYVITNKGTYNASECNFGYRTSRFLNSEVILKVCFSLVPCDEDIISDKIKMYKSFRKNPKGRNCGSVFKNDGFFAGKVIDEVGLKGFKVNGAKISNEHANFIIAEENCTSKDIYTLIHKIKFNIEHIYSVTLLDSCILKGFNNTAISDNSFEILKRLIILRVNPVHNIIKPSAIFNIENAVFFSNSKVTLVRFNLRLRLRFSLIF